MPQLTQFPTFGADARVVLVGLTDALLAFSEGESLATIRAKLREKKAWDDLAPGALFALIGSETPNAFSQTPMLAKLAAAPSEDAKLAIWAERLFIVNPILAKTVVTLVSERAYGKDEIYKVLGSSAYRGTVPSRPALEAWLQLAMGVGVLRPLGIAMAKGPAFAAWEQAARDIDVDDYLAADVEMIVPSVAAPAPASPSAASVSTRGVPNATAEANQSLSSVVVANVGWPLELGELSATSWSDPKASVKVAPASTLSDDFAPSVLEQTADAFATWWQQQPAHVSGFGSADFGWQAEAWIEQADEQLFRVAVAAAFVFRLHSDRSGVVAAYQALEQSGLLADLYQGTLPDDLSVTVDGRALMLATLIARRFAEAPELAVKMEQQRSAADVFSVLSNALGRGLFRSELFWIMQQLVSLGIVRHADAAEFVVVPHRGVRDTLFRLGFLPSPYASDVPALTQAAKAAQLLAPSAPPHAVAAFATAAGCQYSCQHRKQCGWACRERLE